MGEQGRYFAQKTKYIIDASSLIELKDKYTQEIKIFEPIWELLTNLANKEKLVSTEHVHREVKIRIKDQKFNRWRKNNENIFKRELSIDPDVLRNVISNYQNQSKFDDEIESADPWLIALGIMIMNSVSLLEIKPIIVTEESPTKPDKIPFIAKKFGIETIKVLDLIQRES